MRKRKLYLLLVLWILSSSCNWGTAPEGISLKLWYTQPTEIWGESLPIGNGRLGAMVFGGTSQRRISS